MRCLNPHDTVVGCSTVHGERLRYKLLLYSLSHRAFWADHGNSGGILNSSSSLSEDCRTRRVQRTTERGLSNSRTSFSEDRRTRRVHAIVKRVRRAWLVVLGCPCHFALAAAGWHWLVLRGADWRWLAMVAAGWRWLPLLEGGWGSLAVIRAGSG